MSDREIIALIINAVALLEPTESQWARAEWSADRGKARMTLPGGLLTTAMVEAVDAVYARDTAAYKALADECRVKRDQLRKQVIDNTDAILSIARPIKHDGNPAAMVALKNRILSIQQAFPVQRDGWEHCVEPSACCVDHAIVEAAQAFLGLLQVAYTDPVADVGFVPSSDFRALCPWLTGQQTEALRRRLERWRNSSEDDCRYLDDPNTGKPTWFYPRSKVIELARE